MKHLTSLITFVPAFFLSACASSPQKTQELMNYYIPPQTTENTATIIGDMVDRKYLADTIAFIFAVDKQKVAEGYHKIKELLVLEAGEHDLQIWCGQGAFNYTNLIKVKIEANKTYQVGYELNPNDREGCAFWITDLATKKPVTELVFGTGLWRANPIIAYPIQHFLEPQPSVGQGYTVPIRVVNKMR